MSAPEHTRRSWTLLTNHGRVLILLAQRPEMRLRDIAEATGITERAAQMIIADLEQARYIDKERLGRRNVYSVNRSLPLLPQADTGVSVGQLMDLLSPPT